MSREFQRTVMPEHDMNEENSYDGVPVFRMSTDEAEELARQSDGLQPGQVVLSHETARLPDLFGSLDEQTLNRLHNYSVTEIIYDPGLSGLENEKDTSESDNFHSMLYYIRDIGSIIAGLKDDKNEPSNSLSNQKRAVLGFVETFMEENPKAVLDPDEPGSLHGLGRLLDFYRERVHYELNLAEVIQPLQENRAALVSELRTTGMRRHLGRVNAERIAGHFERQPLIVVDPLTTLLSFDSKIEPLGWFELNKRACYIDPISIRSSANRCADYFEGSDRLFEAQLLKTMAHEFMHAATDTMYRGRSWEDGQVGVRSNNLWPQFFYEGMVEKSAYLLAVKTRPELFKGKMVGQTKERLFRQICSDDPGELLVTNIVRNARDSASSSYVEYRLLIDTMMEKADWPAAGVTRKQADRLAIDAFFDRPDDTTSCNWSARKGFMQAVHQAASPGFLNRLGELVEIYGVNQALDVLESPAFDPHDTDSIPWLVSPREHCRLYRATLASVEAAKGRYEKVCKMDAGEEIKAHYNNALERLETDHRRRSMLQAATDGLKVILAARYGKRNRVLSSEERLIISIFGNPSVKKHNPEQVDDQELQKAQESLRAWREL